MSLISSKTIRASNIEWDSNSKEPWYFEFEKEPVNDKKWSCIVTAAVPTEVQDEEYIQIYNECVSLGLRKAIKTITISDVIKLLKGKDDSKNNNNNNKKEKPLKNDKNKKEKTKPELEVEKKSDDTLKPPISPFFRVVELAAKYASEADNECKLPPDLMAAVIKYMILNLKEESVLQKKVNAVKERKIREHNIKAKFIRNLKPYETNEEEEKVSNESANVILNLKEPINDEPIDGPDLYVMLVDFYDLRVFFEFERINVPFLAFVEISTFGSSGFARDSSVTLQKSEGFGKRKSLILSFWEKYKSDCSSLENAVNYKNIATVKYQLSAKPMERSTLYRIIFDEVSWTLYSVYCIYRQHQKYLKELHVQRLITALEPLDLSRCVVYNKLCDVLITGEPLTPLLILYSMIEQVVAGVPETNSQPLEYQPQPTDFFSDGSEDLESFKKAKKQKVTLVTPCLQCRDKKYENICDKLKEDVMSRSSESSVHGEWSPLCFEYNDSLTPSQKHNTTAEEPDALTAEYIIPESLLDQAISERLTERDYRNKKKWKTPSLCFYGDSIFLQTFHCQPRIFDSETLVERFLKNTELPQVWTTYPELTPGDKALYNFHFSFLKKNSKKSEEDLKLYIHFSMSMKLVGITKSFTYKGDDVEDLSDVIGAKDKVNNLSKVKFSNGVFNSTEYKNEFDSYFYKTFIRKIFPSRKFESKKTVKKIDAEITKKSAVLSEAGLLHKAKSGFLISPTTLQDTATYYSIHLKQFGNEQSGSLQSQENDDKELMILSALLDCPEISSLTHPHLIDKENFLNLVKDFKFYEKLDRYLMIQRLFEVQDEFNTTQCSYFPPTDTVIIIMYDDYDHRGVSFRTTTQALRTPVNFRDFYSHVFGEITYWLIQEMQEHKKFVKELEEKAKIEKEKKDGEYLSNLKQYYCGMSEEERKIFLETGLQKMDVEVHEKDLEELSVKSKPLLPDKLSFVVTNYTDSRVEFTRRTHEFNSPEGTEIKVKIENWLYAPSSLLRVKIKRSNFQLYYNHWLGEEKIETSFTFKTSSDIIFSFYKTKPDDDDDDEEKEEEEEDEDDYERGFNYHVTISWPVGLLIQPVTINSNFYIKQSYLKPYKRGWDIEAEASRCFVRNGQVVIFKEYGGYDILCPSGTKYTFFDSTPKYEITSTTGEIWEVSLKGRCKNKKNLLATLKVFVGIDTKNQETYYKREDGVYCMLWGSGKLVTTYPDGTKITTIPDFDENEIQVEWTEDEKRLLKDKLVQSKLKSDQSIDKISSRSVFKNSITFSDRRTYDEKFVSISCSYLIEHPKYASVYFNSLEENTRLTMPEDISMFIYPCGNYVLEKKSDFLKVCGANIDFFTECPECRKRTSAKLFLDESDILCKCVNFFNKLFVLYRDGKTLIEENGENSENGDTNISTSKQCSKSHTKSVALSQRCFALERDLSGVEFLHEDAIAFYSDKLSENTFYEINTDDTNNLCHTFTSPYNTVGYENWVMNYEDLDDSLPTTLKKKDLKEMGVKEVTRNIFKYPFPAGHNCGDRLQPEKPKENTEMPKLIIARTIRSWPGDPNGVIDDLQKDIADYQMKTHDIWKQYKNHKVADKWSYDSRYVMMRLKKIALTLNQSLQMYPHLCTQFPSTEREIHYFGHFINSMAELRNHFQDLDNLPDCKQIPMSLPRNSDFPSIYEESESPKST